MYFFQTLLSPNRRTITGRTPFWPVDMAATFCCSTGVLSVFGCPLPTHYGSCVHFRMSISFGFPDTIVTSCVVAGFFIYGNSANIVEMKWPALNTVPDPIENFHLRTTSSNDVTSGKVPLASSTGEMARYGLVSWGASQAWLLVLD